MNANQTVTVICHTCGRTTEAHTAGDLARCNLRQAEMAARCRWDAANGLKGGATRESYESARANVRAAATALAAVAENDGQRRDAAYALRQWA